jgi:tryptophan-rich sensory protein
MNGGISMRNTKRWKEWLVSNAISLGVGAAAAILTTGNMKKYHAMKLPPLSPPSWVFPVVWTILYICMATAAWIIYRSGDPGRKTALRYYAAQLILNGIWPLIFFNTNAYWVAFFWLVLLWYLIYTTMKLFVQIDTTAGRLMLPYLVWSSFALYLNFGVAVLN